MTAVFKRELSSYFKGITGYLFAAFILLFTGIYCMAYNLSGYYANFEYVLSSISFIYLIAVPILTMRSLAEERHRKTDQLLYSLPISLTDVVLGKYLAMLATLAFPLGVVALYPLVLTQFGTVSLQIAYTALIGFFLLGGCLLSIGLFVSAMTESQVAAAVISLVVLLLLYFMSGLASFVSTEASASLLALIVCVLLFAIILYRLSRNGIIAAITAVVGVGALCIAYFTKQDLFSGLFPSIMEKLSVFERFDSFVDGILDLTAVVYYLSISGVCVFLTVQTLEKRRWSE